MPDLVEPDDREAARGRSWESTAAARKGMGGMVKHAFGKGFEAGYDAGAAAADRQSAAIRQELADMAKVAYRGNEREKVLEAQVRALTDALADLIRAAEAIDAVRRPTFSAQSNLHVALVKARAALPVPGQCDSVFLGQRCELPAGHLGKHRVEHGEKPGMHHRWENPSPVPVEGEADR